MVCRFCFWLLLFRAGLGTECARIECTLLRAAVAFRTVAVVIFVVRAVVAVLILIYLFVYLLFVVLQVSFLAAAVPCWPWHRVCTH